ncbi:hypothetical protein [uncultured Dokdonia sp.]|uniref:hypothetical protein n=1 Tax=uncultured Dokdonia sp. TaxID=575653 RepID=UPI002619323B|nr:hypothetical protein [uncultured Dokdonia sp.]
MKFYIDIFKNIASEENGKFYFSDEGLAIGWGVRSPQMTFQLEIPYKDYIIYISNKTGTQYIGRCICKLPLAIKAPDFTIETKSHFSTLFSFNKNNRFKIISKHKKLSVFLKDNDTLKQLNKIAKDSIFEPTISGTNSETEYILTTKYHLEFDNWTHVLKPLIKLNKELINILTTRDYSLV